MTTLCSNISNMTYFQQHGILLGSIKYQFLRGEEGGQVMAKKKGCGGITIQASNSGFFTTSSMAIPSYIRSKFMYCEFWAMFRLGSWLTVLVVAIVMAHCKEGGQQGNVNKAVSVIVDYLKSQNM